MKNSARSRIVGKRNMAMKGDFTNNLGKIYSIYVGGFAAFVVSMAILEQLGLPPKYILWSYMALTILVYAIIGILSRTSKVSEYYVAAPTAASCGPCLRTAGDRRTATKFADAGATAASPPAHHREREGREKRPLDRT